MDEKGQASTEVLILIAGAVVAAIAVGLYLKEASKTIETQAHNVSANIVNDLGN